MSNKMKYSLRKKFIALLLLQLFYFGATGFTVSIHQCLSKGTSVSLLKQKKCCCSSTEGMKDCCKKSVQKFKTGDKYFVLNKEALPEKQIFSPVVFFNHYLLLTKKQNINKSLYSGFFLPDNTIPFFIFNKALLI